MFILYKKKKGIVIAMKKKVKSVFVAVSIITASLSVVPPVYAQGMNEGGLSNKEKYNNATEFDTRSPQIVEEELSENLLHDDIEECNLQPVYNNVEDWEDNEGYSFPDSIEKNWGDLNSHEEMLDVCAVPEELLKSASTEKLFDLLCEYPLLIDMYAYSTDEDGIKAIISQSNIAQELLKRDDAARVLLNRYASLNVSDFYDETSYGGNSWMLPDLIEGLLARPEIVGDFNDTQKEELLEEAKRMRDEKSRDINYSWKADSFYEALVGNDTAKVIDVEVTYDKTPMKSQTRKAELYVRTPKGTKVTVLRRGEMSAYAIRKSNEDTKRKYPKATFVSTATQKYNCHSYAWYSRSTSNPYWMNVPKAYVQDGSYRYIGSKAKANNNVVVYKYQRGPVDDWLHSGVVYNYKNSTITSKWGSGPLMRHNVGYSPYNKDSNAIHYYKR